MIFMFLQPGNVDDEHTLFSGQAGLQVFFVLCAVFSIPVMLLGKPCYTKRKLKEKHEQEARLLAEQGHGHDEEVAIGQPKREGLSLGEGVEHEHKGETHGATATSAHGDDAGHEVHSFSDDMIHSSIHTIEFVLGN
jgi:V-type H+-transporting ATPase subunit a